MEPRQRLVKVFFDTSVLFPAFNADHVHHEPSINAFLGIEKGQGYCAGHTLAEFYAVTTRYPSKDRVGSGQIMLFLETIRERLTIITLTADEYYDAVNEAAAIGIVGGLIYDMLLARCALKAGAEILYTWNTKHFEQLGPDISRRLRLPSGAGDPL
jgi:predicted nucleic acid-binding protein